MANNSNEWSDSKKWAMGILGSILIASIIALFTYLNTGEVKLFIASVKTDNGRCIDRELFIVNETDEEIEDIMLIEDWMIQEFNIKSELTDDTNDIEEKMELEDWMTNPSHWEKYNKKLSYN